MTTGFLCAGALIFSDPASARPPEWFGEPYGYVVLDQDVRAALTEFGRNLGVPVVLSDAVSGRVRGRVEAEDAGGFLERLANANGLTWYFDGSAVAAQMDELGLSDERFSIRGTRGGNVITVSGPPAYIGAADQLVQRMQPEPVVIGDDPRVRVFRGGLMTEIVAAREGRAVPPAQGGQEADPPQ